jgi:hypothetical protein
MPADFTAYFAASAGAAAALVGLLFVAVSLSPERTVGQGAPFERQVLAEGSFTALANAFFLSLGALIPNLGVGPLALTVGAIALWHSLWTGFLVIKARTDLWGLVRRLVYMASGLTVYGFECFVALQSMGAFGHPQPEAIYSLAIVLLAVLAIGLTRAWMLLGARRHGLFGWLSPLDPSKADERGTDKPRT